MHRYVTETAGYQVSNSNNPDLTVRVFYILNTGKCSLYAASAASGEKQRTITIYASNRVRKHPAAARE